MSAVHAYFLQSITLCGKAKTIYRKVAMDSGVPSTVSGSPTHARVWSCVCWGGNRRSLLSILAKYPSDIISSYSDNDHRTCVLQQI